MEYYKLILEREVVKWGMSKIKKEEVYLEINKERSEIMAYIPEERKPLSTKIEKISEEEAVEALNRTKDSFEDNFNF